MSRYFSQKYQNLAPYVPGEQPRDRQYIKLNTNESPFPPSPKAQEYVREAAKKLELYSDPECRELREKAAQMLGISEDEIIFTNGSDEILNFAFMAFCDETHGAAFPNITYGFYKVFAELNRVPYTQIPLDHDFRIRAEDYMRLNKTIFIANPNAPTGLALSTEEIEAIIRGNPESVVVIDEAYVDFGGESSIPLIHKYNNLLVIQTFSKSRSLAGARLGFGVGCQELIRDLNAIKYSTNPFNVNRMTMAAGLGALEDRMYFEKNCRTIMENRLWLTHELRRLGFTVLDSLTNFVLAKHAEVSGKKLYSMLKQNGILVRHFDTPLLTDYNRITIGNMQQMQALVDALTQILEGSL